MTEAETGKKERIRKKSYCLRSRTREKREEGAAYKLPSQSGICMYVMYTLHFFEYSRDIYTEIKGRGDADNCVEVWSGKKRNK